MDQTKQATESKTVYHSDSYIFIMLHVKERLRTLSAMLETAIFSHSNLRSITLSVFDVLNEIL